MSQCNDTPSQTPQPVSAPANALANAALGSGVWANNLAALAPAKIPWLWHGYLAPGSVTLLTSQWKSGKTTLVSVLLARLKDGGQLAGLPLQAGKVLVITEESATDWHLRNQKLDFGSHVCFFCRPFRGKPTLQEWQGFLEGLAEFVTQHNIRLVVVDPFQSFFTGRNESSAAGMLEFLMPLRQLAMCGVSVLVLHHPRKGDPIAGQAARGSGALSAYVDIIIEMQYCARPSDTDRRRRLQAYSRYEATCRQRVIELNADGTDYSTHGAIDEDEFARSWCRLRVVLEDATQKLTRREIRADWPPDDQIPNDLTLWRWLDRAVSQRLVCRDGAGRKNNPFRYWLAEQEEKWLQDPLYQLRMAHEEALRMLDQPFTPPMDRVGDKGRPAKAKRKQSSPDGPPDPFA